ncbi:serine acetyltransferase [Escherichia albertii]|nr:serine acetyltransferase [Escherichia albertii]MCU7272572.1 serine acetyltransferase [Escherichia albertii]
MFILKEKSKELLEFYYSLKYYKQLKMPISNHFTIGIKTLGEKGVVFPHPIGIVIGKKVIIGRNCIVYQNVTIGVRNNKHEEYPIIGNDVTIYAGAIVIGKVVIGDNAIIGAGCIVTKDVPAGRIAVGSPMKIIDKKLNY